MGMSKKDISRKRANIKAKLEILERKAKNDPLKRNEALHEEIAELKRKLEEN